MNGTYNQMPAPMPTNNPLHTRSLVTKIFSSIIAVLIPLMMFAPCVSMYSYSTLNGSLMDVYKSCFEYFSLRNSISSRYNSSYLATSDFIIVIFFILITLILLFSIFILILSLVKYSKSARITALILSILNTLIIFVIFIILLIAISTANNLYAGYSISWGIIVQIILSIAEIVFTTIAISCAQPQYNMMYPNPQISQLQPQPPVGVSVNSQVGAPINIPEITFPQTLPSSEPIYPSDDGQTIAQFGVLKGIKGDYASAEIRIMPAETLLIGRDSKICNIVIASEKVSRKHCSIEYDALNRCYIVVDFSANGTIINNSQRIPKNVPTRLQLGTEISIGNEDNVFRLD